MNYNTNDRSDPDMFGCVMFGVLLLFAFFMLGVWTGGGFGP